MPDPSRFESTERLRILYLIPSFNMGGAEVQLLSLVRGIDKTKFDVTVAAFYDGGDLADDFSSTKDIDVVCLRKKGGLDFLFTRHLSRLIRRKNIQIIQCYNVSARLVGILAAKMSIKPIVIVTERTARLLYSSFGSRVYLFLEKYALRSADFLIANSKAGQTFAVLRGFPIEKSTVIYNGIDARRLIIGRQAGEVRRALNIPSGAFVVGMAARIESIKDPMILVEAARKARQSFDDIYFVLVGDGPLLESVKAKVGELNMQPFFLCPGRRKDSIDFLNALDVAVLTSNKIEGCSNSILEAMFLGKPVVATRVGGNVEVVEQERTGLLILPESADELSAAILRLRNDPDLRSKLGENAQQSARDRFSQSTMVRQHEGLYQKLKSDSGKSEWTRSFVGETDDAGRRGHAFVRSDILGCPVDQMTLRQCLDYLDDVLRAGRHCHIVVVNAAKVVKARKDDELQTVIDNADIVGADGVPIVWASRVLGQPLPGRVNGTDLMNALFEESAKKGRRLYLLGAKAEVIKTVVENLRKLHPTINIVGYRHGYFESPDEETDAVADINAARPDVLLLGFGTPMKEKWVKRHKQQLDVPIIHGVGGSFDIVGGLTKRAPVWMQNSGLEWLFRLIQEPGRMWRRYLSTNTVFVWLVLRAWLRRIMHSS